MGFRNTNQYCRLLCRRNKENVFGNRKCKKCGKARGTLKGCVVYNKNNLLRLKFYCFVCLDNCAVCGVLTSMTCESEHTCLNAICYEHCFTCEYCYKLICNGKLCARIDESGERMCTFCCDEMICNFCNINSKEDVNDRCCVLCKTKNMY